MARPWQSHVVQYKLVEAFKAANIGMILNLQVGEQRGSGHVRAAKGFLTCC